MERGTDAWKDDKKHEINRKRNYPERWKLNEKRKKNQRYIFASHSKSANQSSHLIKRVPTGSTI